MKVSRATRELAAMWCSIMACDRACSAWTIKFLDPECGPPEIRIAWRAYQDALTEPYRAVAAARLRGGRYGIDLGFSADTAPERWARAEAILRGGPLP